MVRHGWGQIPILSNAKYLGIPVGRDIDQYDIFTEPTRRLFDRLNHFGELRKQLPIDKRVIVANVFMIPTLAYTWRFYQLPSDTLATILTGLRKFIVPYGTFKMEALCAPTKEVGLKNPLKDIELMNIAAIGAAGPPGGSVGGHPLHPATHGAKARAYLRSVLEEDDTSGSSHELYTLLLGSARLMQDRRAELQRKVSLLHVEGGNWENLWDTWEHIPNTIPEQYRVNTIKAIYNAHPTLTRTRHFLQHRDRHCTLCGQTREVYQHFFNNCPSVRAAWGTVGPRYSIRGPMSFARVALLNRVRDVGELLVLMAFGFAVWRIRNDYASKSGGPHVGASGGIQTLTDTCVRQLRTKLRKGQWTLSIEGPTDFIRISYTASPLPAISITISATTTTSTATATTTVMSSSRRVLRHSATASQVMSASQSRPVNTPHATHSTTNAVTQATEPDNHPQQQHRKSGHRPVGTQPDLVAARPHHPPLNPLRD